MPCFLGGAKNDHRECRSLVWSHFCVLASELRWEEPAQSKIFTFLILSVDYSFLRTRSQARKVLAFILGIHHMTLLESWLCQGIHLCVPWFGELSPQTVAGGGSWWLNLWIRDYSFFNKPFEPQLAFEQIYLAKARVIRWRSIVCSGPAPPMRLRISYFLSLNTKWSWRHLA